MSSYRSQEDDLNNNERGGNQQGRQYYNDSNDTFEEYFSHHENIFQDAFSDISHETFDEEERKPRGFQQELIDTVLKDNHNYIVFAPTGCGKTFIASMITKYYLEKKALENKKATILFIADKIPLVLQQGEAIKADIGGSWNVEKYCGDTGGITNWRVAIESAHVLVLTAQILVNCLLLNPGALKDVDLMIFDECHHTTREHPYHVLIKYHWKLLPGNRPKILGLTASPGGDEDLLKTRTKIRQLCENMHSKIIKVQENKAELESIQNPPKVELIEITLDSYLVNLVKKIELLMAKIEANSKNHRFPYTWPEKRNSVEYMRFCEQIKDSSSYSKEVRFSCGLNLILANCIQLLEDFGLESVIDYLSSNWDFEYKKEVSKLLEEFKKAYRPGLVHGKRDTLTRRLKTISGDPAFKRGIVFVKTRASAYALRDSIQRNDLLKNLRSCILVGHGGSGSDGMKSKSQKVAVKEFNEGIKNLIKDIQACNTVIRYDALSTAEALIQSRGRARFPHSTFIVLMAAGDRSKFFSALEAEKNMHTVVDQVQKNPRDFYDFFYQPIHSQNYSTSSSSTSSTSTPSSSYPSPSSSSSSSTSISSIVTKYGQKAKPVEYSTTPTKKGYLCFATVYLRKAKTTESVETYAKTEQAAKLQADKEIENLLFEKGELEGVIDFSTLPTSSPSSLSSPSPRITSYSSSSSSTSLVPSPSSSSSSSNSPFYSAPAIPFNNYPPNLSYNINNNNNNNAIVPRVPELQKLTYKMIGQAKYNKGNAIIRMANKTGKQYLNEWCQKMRYALPAFVSTPAASNLFCCSITIKEVGITITGEACPQKMECEHNAATYVIGHLNCNL